MHKVFVLLSGGIDSSTTLAMARRDFPNDEFECVTVDYGQRHKREADCAFAQAEMFRAEHIVLDMRGILQGMLVDKGVDNEKIPDVSYADLAPGISPTYVSFRNGFMLSLLAARAQAWVMAEEKKWDNYPGGRDSDYEPIEATIYAGMHADDAANDAYPDCTLEFAGSMANAIYIGTYFKVRLRVPIIHMEKSEVVRIGTELGVDYSNTWSCYVGEEVHCGVCPTCRSRKDAFASNGYPDPTVYAE